MRRTITKDIFHPSHRLESCERVVGTSSGTSEGSKPSGSPVRPTVGPHTKSEPPTTFIRSRSVSKPMPEFDHYSLTGRMFLLPPEENGERSNFHPTNGISEIFSYIEFGFSSSKSIKQYGSSYSLPDIEQHETSYNLLTQWEPGEKPLQPPLFRKVIATRSFISFGFSLNTISVAC